MAKKATKGRAADEPVTKAPAAGKPSTVDAVIILRSILERCRAYTGRLNVPGDWGERSFRGWLILDLIASGFGWPSSHIVLGERHDILLLNRQLSPVITVETKRPGYTAGVKEVHDFEARLEHYGTLEWAYMSNGSVWTRLELSAPRGRLTVTRRDSLNIDNTDFLKAAIFFNPLDPNRYLA